LEQEFGIAPFPFNWPIGSGPSFAGVYDRLTHQAHLYQRTERGAYQAPVELTDIHDPKLEALLGERELGLLSEALELHNVAGDQFDESRFLTGAISPVFFGSAVNNFDIDIFLSNFIGHAPTPGPRATNVSVQHPGDEELTGFIFKIQANMDKQH